MILITGATGNIGSALLEQYRAKGAPSGGVRALTRGADKAAELRAGGVEAAIGDFDHLTGPQALSWAEVAQALSAATGKEVRYQDVPPEAFGATLRGHGVPEFLVGALLSLYAVYRAGYAATVTDDVRCVTGSAPRTLAQFAADHAAAFRGA